MKTQEPSQPTALDVLLQEDRIFKPSADFSAQAVVADRSMFGQAEKDFESFWESQARKLNWEKPWSRVLQWDPPNARWFEGGTLNACVNCVDRHIEGPHRDKAALIWEGEPGDTRTLTYYDVYVEVNRFAGVLQRLGVKRGDRVAIYLPMIPELVLAMLACARIGAIHSVVFAGFSSESLAQRIDDAGAVLLITADGSFRRGKTLALKQISDEALNRTTQNTVRNVLLVKRGFTDFKAPFTQGRDHWYHELMAEAPSYVAPEPMQSTDLLFTLYTSGSTGRPKGIAHGTGGYLVGVSSTTRWVFDLKDDDVYWCTADCGWITGHSYVVYGPMSHAVTQVIYEGAIDWPERGRVWSMIEKYGVTKFYTAPTAIRTFMSWGDSYPQKFDLSSLRLLGSVGEPINPKAWTWYHEVIGQKRCPVVDTWWQTETGMILIAPLPGITPCKPGSATFPLPGVAADVVDAQGQSVPNGGGALVIRRPWPAMLQTIWGDHERYRSTYFGRFGDSVYVTGDGAKRDADGYIWVLGRIDDVINVAGHRIGTMEVESALVAHQDVAEAACVGIQDEIKGQNLAAFVTLNEGVATTAELEAALKQHVAAKIGAIARPQKILFTAGLPKTRSGKIMRRLLRDVAEGRTLGDTTTLADPSVIEQLKSQYADREES